MDYDNTNRGALFKNEKKAKDTHSDYNGNINVEGVEYWIDAWVKEGRDTGKKFFSLSVKPKQPKKDYDNEDVLNDKDERGTYGGLEDVIPFAWVGIGMTLLVGLL